MHSRADCRRAIGSHHLGCLWGRVGFLDQLLKLLSDFRRVLVLVYRHCVLHPGSQ